MPDVTTLNSLPVPVEHEEPYFTTMQSYFIAMDQGVWALAENDNLIWAGGGNFSWSGVAGTLVWGLPVYVTAKTSPYRAVIQGPPAPGGQVTLQDGQVAYFKMPRHMVADQIVPLQVGSITVLPGTRLHDIKIFAVRVGTTVYFADGHSLKDGEIGEIFGAGLGTTVPPHEHQPSMTIEPPFAGTTVLDLNIASFAPSVLKKVQLYRNGQLLAAPDDYTVVLSTGIVTLVVPTIMPLERFVALRETSPTAGSPGDHLHLQPRIVNPPPGTTQVDCLVTSLDDPALQRVDVFRNGAILVDPDDYTIDLTTGLITLATATVLGERIVVQREVD